MHDARAHFLGEALICRPEMVECKGQQAGTSTLFFLGRAQKVRAAGAGAFLRGREIRNYVSDELPRALRIMMRKKGQEKKQHPRKCRGVGMT